MSTATLNSPKQKMTGAELKLAVLASIVYFVNYLARYDFSASLAESSLFFGKEIIGLSLTVNAITYGAGQIITGILGDKIPPKYAVTAGLLGTGLCNLMIGLIKTPALLVGIWGLNGLMQAMIWPSLVRQLAHDLSSEAYNKTIVATSVASSASSVLIYLAIVPAAITISSWRLAFYFATATAVATAVWWFFSVKSIKAEKTDFSKIDLTDGEEPAGKETEGKKPVFSLIVLSGIPVIYIMIACHGLLRESIGDWMPVLMAETFNLSNVSAIMSGAIVPLFGVISVFVASKIYDIVKKEMLACLILWGSTIAFAAVLYFFIGYSPVLVVILMGLLATCIHGINHIVTTRMQTHFKDAGLVSTVTGLLNSATYAGAAISGYGIAVFSDKYGWKNTVLLWAGVVALGILFTLIVYRRWTKFAAEHN
ncbi:MAG: MFS transporter [Clostridia bacterium]|nr:MFS transporter [Clostridia bacterium]